jgi:hypothetical protein
MKRSAFLKIAAAAAGVASVTQTAPGAAAESKRGHEYIEIRKYTLKASEKLALFDAYMKDVAIPALNKLGVASVGVFRLEKTEEKPVIYVVLRFASLEQFAASTQLLADEGVQKAGVAYLGVPATDPIYERIESWLTRGIDSMPALAVPAKGNQVYQLRIYESHSEAAGRKKIEMFDMAELAIFRRCGMEPVFFGGTIVGPNMPNLTYMLTFKDTAAKDAGWGKFRVDPEWAKLKATPGFTDKEIVFRITNLMLTPAAYSQI